MLLLGSGGFFARRIYQQNRPQPIWVPLALNPELAADKQHEIANELKQKLLDPKILLQVSKDLKLPAKFALGSDEAAAREISQRLFVDVGEADSPTGLKVPSINVGINGKRKEAGLSGEIAIRLMQEVWKILGLKAPEKPF